MPDEHISLTNEPIDFDWGLRKSGRLILAQPLMEPETAVTLRRRDGRLSSTDGSFAATKEHLGGFFLVEARDMDEAAALAGSSPMAAMGSIEVRPLLEQTHSETGSRRPEPTA